MSLLAENLVEEWMNRQGFFTIRGIRDGVAEIDLLGVRPRNATPEAWHVESQVSLNPISYSTPLTAQRAALLGKAKTTAWKRPCEVVAESVVAWVEKKFNSKAKTKARERLWPRLQWKKKLVQGVAKYAEKQEKHDLFGATGTHLANIVEYHEDITAQRQEGDD